MVTPAQFYPPLVEELTTLQQQIAADIIEGRYYDASQKAERWRTLAERFWQSIPYTAVLSLKKSARPREYNRPPAV